MVGQSWTRRGFGRTAVAGALATVGALALSSCSEVAETGDGSTLQRLQESGTITVGIANEAPYGFQDASGEPTGEAPEVAKAVFAALGIENVEAQVVDFNSLIPGLNASQFDMVAAGMNITPQRCGQAAFSIPDYTAKTALLVPAGNPEGVQDFADLAEKGLSVAVLSAAVEKGFAEAAGVTDIQTLDTQDSMLRAVDTGRVYAAALTDISLNWLVKNNPDASVEVTPGFDPVVDGEQVQSAGGFVFRTADTELRDAFNAELAKLQESGEWVTLAEPFGFSEDNLPPPDLTTEKLCAG